MTSLLLVCATKVQVCGPNLEAAIRDVIEGYKEAILKSDLGGLTQLQAKSKNITNLNGVEHCTNLQGLFLSNNQIIDISPLSNMTKLRRLELQANQIIDISPLGSMTILKYLCLTGNQIIDISPLSNLANLQTLYLDGNQISDITPLSNLTNLRQLYLDHNRITNISSLKALTKVGGSGGFWVREGISVHLGLSNNQISDISPLVHNSGIGKGDGVDLRKNPLNDEAHDVHIPALIERDVKVLFDSKPEEGGLRINHWLLGIPLYFSEQIQ